MDQRPIYPHDQLERDIHGQLERNLHGEVDRQFCVNMNIFSYKVKNKVKNRLKNKAIKESVPLRININFYIERCTIPLGHIDVGIKKGQLSLKMLNASMSLGDTSLRNPLKTEVEVSRRKEEGLKESQSFENKKGAKFTASIRPIFKLGKEEKNTHNHEHSGNLTEEYSYTDYIVTFGGSDSEPFWYFQAKGVPILEGGLIDKLLSKISIHDRPCQITAYFKLLGKNAKNLYISGSEGVWPENMTTNHRIIRSILIWNYLQSRIEPYLKRAYLEL